MPSLLGSENDNIISGNKTIINRERMAWTCILGRSATVPGFFSSNLAQIIIDTFVLKLIGDADDDIAAMMGD